MRKQFNPFSDSFSRYGAQMGRQGTTPSNLQDVKRLHCRHQGGGDGYDKGGAYWGYPSNVYAVWAKIDATIDVVYVRAGSRNSAIDMVRKGL